jgi:hypothetical protein
MAGQLLPGGSLAGGGWELSDEVGGYVGEGKVVDDQPQWSKGNGDAFFKHSQALAAGDVWRMKVVEGGGAYVGIAGAAYDPKRHMETMYSLARVRLDDGYTYIFPDISLDGEASPEQDHLNQLLPHIPEIKPYQLALRIEKESNVLQLQFNDDGVWHDFVPEGKGALKAGPWFPYLVLDEGGYIAEGKACLTDHRVDRPRARKSAGFKQVIQQAPLDVAAAGGAGASDDPASPPQKKVKHAVGGGSD